MNALQVLETAEDLEALFAEWNTLLFRYVYLRVEDKEDAENITQQAFLAAWQYRHTYNAQKATLKNWLFAIAINEIKHYYNDKKKHDTDSLEFAEEVGSTEDIEQDSETLLMIEFITSQLQTMKPKEQTLLNLRYREGLSVPEIATRMKMELSATKVALHRAMEKLKELCQKE